MLLGSYAQPSWTNNEMEWKKTFQVSVSLNISLATERNLENRSSDKSLCDVSDCYRQVDGNVRSHRLHSPIFLSKFGRFQKNSRLQISTRSHRQKMEKLFIILSCMFQRTPSKYLCMNENIELEEKKKRFISFRRRGLFRVICCLLWASLLFLSFNAIPVRRRADNKKKPETFL